jgi:peptidoglycan hydrolase-like protein with peptidoglycan-binding domain
MILQLGSLDPISEVSGLKHRLSNLGFYRGPLDSTMDDKTKMALQRFQSAKGLPVTGVADSATTALLQKLHGH